MVYFLKQQVNTFPARKKYLADFAWHSSVTHRRSDNGAEFTPENFVSLLINNHIKPEKSEPYFAHRNGTAERSWQSLFRKLSTN